MNSCSTGRLVTIDEPKITLDEIAEVIEILDVDRPVETELVHDFGMAFRRHDALARHQHDRISGQQADEGEGDDGNTEEGGDQDRKAPDEKSKHGSICPY
jgi:hypothetical protein